LHITYVESQSGKSQKHKYHAGDGDQNDAASIAPLNPSLLHHLPPRWQSSRMFQRV
jgi:hypothetical protein